MGMNKKREGQASRAISAGQERKGKFYLLGLDRMRRLEFDRLHHSSASRVSPYGDSSNLLKNLKSRPAEQAFPSPLA